MERVIGTCSLWGRSRRIRGRMVGCLSAARASLSRLWSRHGRIGWSRDPNGAQTVSGRHVHDLWNRRSDVAARGFECQI